MDNAFCIEQMRDKISSENMYFSQIYFYIYFYFIIFSTFEEIIFSVERCIVEKKTYLCIVQPEKWPDTRKRFLLYPNIEIANFKGKDRDNSNAHSAYMYIMLKGSPYCTLIRCICSSVRVLFLRSFSRGVWRCQILMSKTSLTLSFYSYLIFFWLTSETYKRIS